MARKIVESVTDDIDGSEDASTVNFAYEGKQYEIDLSDKNKDKLTKALEPFINAARSTGGRRSSGGASRGSNKEELQKIRDWAAENGIEVSPRGRIAQSVVDQYNAAQ